jgi:predicted transcriptional regulator
MNLQLSRDHFEALEQVGALKKGMKPSACIARNGKFLVGNKLLSHHRDGSYTLTDKGREALFVKNCIAGLRAIAADASTPLPADVAAFLGRKSYIVASASAGHFEITAKGRECLADMAENP